ncbi:hypothetical protein D9M69_532530 [compost metagenome]
MPNVRNASASVNVTAPFQSSPPAFGSRVSLKKMAPSAKAKAASATTSRKIAGQPSASTMSPEAMGPKARPTPKLAPTTLNARSRCPSSNSCASDAMPPENAAAAPTPCRALRMSNQTMLLAKARLSENTPNAASPPRNMRLRP